MFQQPSQAAWLTATFSTAEWRSASGLRHNDEVDYEPRSAHGRAVNKLSWIPECVFGLRINLCRLVVGYSGKLFDGFYNSSFILFS